ncbi:MFS transporter [Mycolicibacterium smegmatis]|uniref:MFS transporter n=1 Tax=Mycolicibacterium smegmatis TaxID=1772 RepID=UPI001EFAB0A2|nr:MFS transporter [Mycolicibacterium smegmatis]ULN34263.1 MFS transporter [Mycolicibacterium smegmatis]
MAQPSHRTQTYWERQGIVPHLRWGFVAVTLFMIGDGIEAGFLSPYLDQQGLGSAQVSALWSVYGFVVAVAAWLSGTLSEVFGPRRVMLTGFAIWVVFEFAFLYALMQQNYAMMLVSFGVRGLGYPLFAYGFLVWIAMDTPEHAMGKAVGWYWFFSILGLGVVSSYYAGAVIPVIGELATLASSLVFVGAGGLILLSMVKARKHSAPDLRTSLRSMLGAFTVVVERPKVGIGGVVRVINTLGYYAFVVFLTTYMVREVGLSTSQWQTVWGTMLLTNILGNVLFGYLGDAIGRLRTVAWFGGLGCAISVLGLFYIPDRLGPNFWAILVVAAIYGLCLAGYVPLSAVMPALAPHRVGSAIAILNLAAGLSQFLGPLVAGFVSTIGVAGTIWMICAIHLVGIALTYCLRDAAAASAHRSSAETASPAVAATDLP